MTETLALPSYRAQAAAVATRFGKLKQRPIILDVRNLSKRFATADGLPILALDRVSFQVHRRELLCVIGPSGCGKSTLARVVAGLESCSGGQILLDGKPVDGPGADRGMVFQGYTLFPWLTVKKNIMFGLEVSKGMSTSTAETSQIRQLPSPACNRISVTYGTSCRSTVITL